MDGVSETATPTGYPNGVTFSAAVKQGSNSYADFFVNSLSPNNGLNKKLFIKVTPQTTTTSLATIYGSGPTHLVHVEGIINWAHDSCWFGFPKDTLSPQELLTYVNDINWVLYPDDSRDLANGSSHQNRTYNRPYNIHFYYLDE